MIFHGKASIRSYYLKGLNVLSWSQKHLLLKVLYLNNFFVFTHIQLFIGKGLYLFKNNRIVK